MPPESAVPPITAAAITRSSSSVPMSLEWNDSRAEATTRRERAEHAHDGEDLDRQQPRVDARKLGRVGVAAGGEDVAPEPGAPRHDGHHDGHRDQQQDRDRARRSRRYSPRAWPVPRASKLLRQHPRGHVVGVEDRRRSPGSATAETTIIATSAQSGLTGNSCAMRARRALQMATAAATTPSDRRAPSFRSRPACR